MEGNSESEFKGGLAAGNVELVPVLTLDQVVVYNQIYLNMQHINMINQAPANSQSNNQVYGFLCQKTNIFYAFESEETYQQFLQWFDSQAAQTDSAACQATQRIEPQMVNEADQLEDFEMATHEIMQVFNDPIFGRKPNETELQEIDF